MSEASPSTQPHPYQRHQEIYGYAPTPENVAHGIADMTNDELSQLRGQYDAVFQGIEADFEQTTTNDPSHPGVNPAQEKILSLGADRYMHIVEEVNRRNTNLSEEERTTENEKAALGLRTRFNRMNTGPRLLEIFRDYVGSDNEQITQEDLDRAGEIVPVIKEKAIANYRLKGMGEQEALKEADKLEARYLSVLGGTAISRDATPADDESAEHDSGNDDTEVNSENEDRERAIAQHNHTIGNLTQRLDHESLSPEEREQAAADILAARDALLAEGVDDSIAITMANIWLKRLGVESPEATDDSAEHTEEDQNLVVNPESDPREIQTMHAIRNGISVVEEVSDDPELDVNDALEYVESTLGDIEWNEAQGKQVSDIKQQAEELHQKLLARKEAAEESIEADRANYENLPPERKLAVIRSNIANLRELLSREEHSLMAPHALNYVNATLAELDNIIDDGHEKENMRVYGEARDLRERLKVEVANQSAARKKAEVTLITHTLDELNGSNPSEDALTKRLASMDLPALYAEMIESGEDPESPEMQAAKKWIDQLAVDPDIAEAIQHGIPQDSSNGVNLATRFGLTGNERIGTRRVRDAASRAGSRLKSSAESYRQRRATRAANAQPSTPPPPTFDSRSDVTPPPPGTNQQATPGMLPPPVGEYVRDLRDEETLPGAADENNASVRQTPTSPNGLPAPTTANTRPLRDGETFGPNGPVIPAEAGEPTSQPQSLSDRIAQGAQENLERAIPGLGWLNRRAQARRTPPPPTGPPSPQPPAPDRSDELVGTGA